jgi:hypothetical protein
MMTQIQITPYDRYRLAHFVIMPDGTIQHCSDWDDQGNKLLKSLLEKLGIKYIEDRSKFRELCFTISDPEAISKIVDITAQYLTASCDIESYKLGPWEEFLRNQDKLTGAFKPIKDAMEHVYKFKQI